MWVEEYFQISTLCKEGGRLLCGRAHFFFYYGTKRWSSQDENLRNVTVHMSSSKRVLYLSVEGQKISRGEGGRGKMMTSWGQKKIARRVTSLKHLKEMNIGAFYYNEDLSMPMRASFKPFTEK